MRYYPLSTSLFIRGAFRAASTGVAGGVRSVSTILLNQATAADGEAPGSEIALDHVIAGAGLEQNYFGIRTTVPVQHSVVLQYDFITVFIAACIRRDSLAGGSSISVVIISTEGMADAALLETIMLAAEAKAEALRAIDLPLSGTPSDTIIAACEVEGNTVHGSAGRNTEAGRRIREAVLYGIPEAIRRHDAGAQETIPAFHIFSRIRGDHWIAWTSRDCPYYPCHFEGQSCDFCYCPFYPCHDETLGQWAAGSSGKKVWNCARCRLPHEPEIAGYMKKFPGALRRELMKRAAKLGL